MDDRVKEAAARLRANVYQDDLLGWSDNAIMDRWTLADAWLAEHPADDDEPVTVEWLVASGFAHLKVFKEYEHESGLRYHDSFVGAVVPYDPYWSIKNSVFLPRGVVQTRGDVRRLCRALGVELKEVTP